jgi:hypothetical protein
MLDRRVRSTRASALRRRRRGGGKRRRRGQGQARTDGRHARRRWRQRTSEPDALSVLALPLPIGRTCASRCASGVPRPRAGTDARKCSIGSSATLNSSIGPLVSACRPRHIGGHRPRAPAARRDSARCDGSCRIWSARRVEPAELKLMHRPLGRRSHGPSVDEGNVWDTRHKDGLGSAKISCQLVRLQQ